MIKYSTKTGVLDSIRTECLVLPLKEARALARKHKSLSHLDVCLKDFDEKPGSTALIGTSGGMLATRLLVAGAGKAKLSREDYRKITHAVGEALKSAPVASAVIALGSLKVSKLSDYDRARLLLGDLSKALYWYETFKKPETSRPRIKRVTLLATPPHRAGIAKAVRLHQALDAGLSLARDLGNHPANLCNPLFLAATARKLGRNPKVTVKTLNEQQCEKQGMGAFMSVTQGSDNPGRFIIVEYKGGKAKDRPFVFVGKGITFDSGGISLKPGAGMDEMKFDMCGAAGVLGATKAVIDAKLPVNLVTLVVAAENMPSGKASRPGDVVTSLSGQTIEILNTDAEGRLVLCDALSYAERYKPRSVVDVATLTGACVIALGKHATGLFSNQDKLAGELIAAGEYTGDRAWHMPLWEDYQKQLDSNFADMANVGGKEAGSITAACFLSRYARKYAWAHLDIAGTAWHSGAEKGASGRPVSLLFQYLLNHSQPS